MKTKKERAALAKLSTAMVIFGTIGIFRQGIPLSSGLIAMVRGVIGAVFLLLLCCVMRRRLSRTAIRANAAVLILSGALIGCNWILLFEAYRFTSVPTATLCYYMAPVFVLIASPFVLHAALTRKKTLCVLLSLLGMVFVSGVPETGLPSAQEARGILMGLGAALLYASVMILNQKLHDIEAYDKTVIQLASAAAVLLPYVLLTEDFSALSLQPKTVLLLLVVGVVHTGIAYALYFSSMGDLDVQTVALFSYLDPVVAIVLSMLLDPTSLSPLGMVGAVLILGATLWSELPEKKKTLQEER